MFKSNIKNISYGFIFLAILAFGVFASPADINAAYGTNIFYPGNGDSGQYYDPYYNSNYYQVPVYVQTPPPPAPRPTQTIYSSSTNPNPTTTTRTVANAKTSTTDTAVTEKYTDLAANAISGENGFMPSGLIQWILFAILVLGAVMLVRKIYGGKEKYNAIPMKHD